MNISKIIEGKKTYLGLLILLLGVLGAGDVVSESELALAFDNVLQFAGFIIAVYGRLVTKGN
jgi:hypothetical protein